VEKRLKTEDPAGWVRLALIKLKSPSQATAIAAAVNNFCKPPSKLLLFFFPKWL